MDLLDGLFQRLVVAAHQAAGDLEVLLRGLLAGLQHAANARRVDGERFLHEHVAALRHGVFQVDRPEAGRRGQQHDAAGAQRVDGLLVAVQPTNCRSLGTSTCLANCSARFLRLAASRFVEDVGHGPELGRALGAQGLGGGPGAASAAADQGDLDRVVLAGVGPRRQRAGQGRARHGRAGLLEELAT